MTSHRLLGAIVPLMILSLAAATPAQAKDEGAYYPPRPAPVVELPEAAPPTPAAEISRSSHGRRMSRRARREQLAAAGRPVEQPAPTPARQPADGAAVSSTADGAHESPAPTIQDLVNKHARLNGVPENLAAAVVRIESRFNPRARGGSALGLMQIKVQTARSVGFSGSPSSLFQPETNLQYGMKVLADAYKASNGDICMTLARYQSGHRTTRMSAANRAYCTRARAYIAKS